MWYIDVLLFILVISSFFPNLIYFASVESRHLLYLQLRKSILESQIMCNDDDLIHLGGLALQAEMGKSQYFFLSSSTTLFLLTKQSIFFLLSIYLVNFDFLLFIFLSFFVCR